MNLVSAAQVSMRQLCSEKNRMKKSRSTVAVVALVVISMLAVSNVSLAVTVDSISGEWTNVSGGAYVSSNGVQSNPTAAELRWGEPSNAEDAQSGYDFLSAAPPSFDAFDGLIFSIGTFTHLNNTIVLNTAIDSAQLDVNIAIDGYGNTGPYQFLFTHDETNNDCTPLPDCANDIVTISSLNPSDTFVVGDQVFLLTILGFSVDGGNTITDIFSSPEGGFNSAQLYAMFVSQVPLPAALWLFLTGLAGLAGFRLRERRRAAA